MPHLAQVHLEIKRQVSGVLILFYHLKSGLVIFIFRILDDAGSHIAHATVGVVPLYFNKGPWLAPYPQHHASQSHTQACTGGGSSAAVSPEALKLLPCVVQRLGREAQHRVLRGSCQAPLRTESATGRSPFLARTSSAAAACSCGGGGRARADPGVLGVDDGNEG